MFDTTVEMIEISMIRPNLDDLLDAPMPEGYTMRMYRPGDAAAWARIEVSCGEFTSQADAEARFYGAFPGDDDLRSQRMAFVMAPDGCPCGTISCWMGGNGVPEDAARLHWLGVHEAHQRKGLSKALAAWALQQANALGYRRMALTTQTASWVAIGVYLKAGFVPMPRTPRDAEAWAIVDAKLGCREA